MLDKIIDQDCSEIVRSINLRKFKNKKVLILGGNGFLAGYIQAALSYANKHEKLNCKIFSTSKTNPKGILKKLIKKNKLIKFIKADLNNYNELQKFIELKYNYIFHCATYGQPALFMQDIISTINLNTGVLNFFLDKAKRDKSTFIYFSSSDIYGDTSSFKGSINEKYNFKTSYCKNRYIYPASKLLGEKICTAYKNKFNFPIYIVRPAHTYGPGQSIYDKRAISEFIKKALLKKKIELLDDGKSIKTWGYISEITKMFLNIAQYGKDFIYNTTGNDYVSIHQLAKKISKNIGNVPVKINKKSKKIFKKIDPQKNIINSKKYLNEFKTKYYVKIDRGLKKFITWNIKKYYE